jgi:4a-hydroxytetrahydrobiopterin dehydratase
MFTEALVLSIGLSLVFSSGSTLALPVSRLADAEITRQLPTLPDWRLENGRLTRVFQFKNFVEAIDFVNRLVSPAEAIAHHPDITINYNRVTISLTSHEVGGLSQLDFNLAKEIDRLVR